MPVFHASDPEYFATRDIKRAGARSEFEALADWIAEEYGTRPLNITHHIDSQRLRIIFETEIELAPFRTESVFYSAQVSVAEQFNQLYPACHVESRRVSFWCFEKPAKCEALHNLPVGALSGLRQDIGDQLWTITGKGSQIFFFVHTEQQKKAVSGTPLHREWSSRCIDFLTPYDEFGYFRRDSFMVDLESKENFDKKYQGNWRWWYD